MDSDPRRDSASFVGRHRELEVLRDLVPQPPCVVVVEGEAGVGKTRLVAELLDRPELRGFATAVGHAHNLREPFPLGPILEAVRGLTPHIAAKAVDLSDVTGALRPLLPELGPHLPLTPEDAGEPGVRRHLLFRGLRDVLAVLGPTALVLEDLHWGDELTEEFLRFLVDQLPPGLSLILTYRAEGMSGASALRDLTSRLPGGTRGVKITLPPLRPGEVRQLVGAFLGSGDVSEEFALYLHQRTAGLPMAVEEVLRLLRDRRDVFVRDGSWVRHAVEDLGVPARLRDSILARSARLSPPARKILEAAALLDAPAGTELLASVAGITPARAGEAVAIGLSTALLQESEPLRYELRHALAREAIYQATEGPRREQMHLRAAGVLLRRPHPPLARLAHHFKSAGDGRKWVRYTEAAADQAVELGNEAAASRFIQEALGAPDLPRATRGRLAVKLGKAALHGLAHDEAVGVLQDILEREAVPAGAHAELEFHLGLLLAQTGNDAAAVETLLSAVPRLRRGHPDLAARALAALSIPVSLSYHIDDHLKWLEEAIDLLPRVHDPVVRKAVLVNRSSVLTHLGDPRASEAVEDVLALEGTSTEERRESVRALVQWGEAALHLGYYERARGLGAEALRLSEEIDYHRFIEPVESQRIRIDWAVGNWADVDRRLGALVDGMDSLSCPRQDVLSVMGALSVARGDPQAAVSLLSPVLETPDTGMQLTALTACGAPLARAHLVRGHLHECLGVVRQVAEAIRRKGIWIWATDLLPVAIEAQLGCDQRSDAEELVEEFAAGVRGSDAPAAMAALAFCRGLLAEARKDWETAASHYQESAEAWKGLGCVYEAARVREAGGRCMLDAGIARGVEDVRSALDEFEALGASSDAGRVRRTMRERRIGLGHRGGRKGYGGTLSPRETEVVRFVLQGRTYREIGEAMYLSPRTVRHHLERAMTRLGVSSRPQLAEVVDGVPASQGNVRHPPP